MGKMISSILISTIITLLIMTSCCLSKNNITVDCVPGERKALMRFKASFSDDPSNSRLSSWKANTECCSWAGVECDNITGHVVGLDLSSTWLRSDTIDPSILELKYLSYLDLSGNDFNGSSIPKFLGSMKQLQYLNLSNAFFTGIVPHQLGNLSSLRALDLRGDSNRYLIVDDVTTWAGNLSSLEYLDMSWVNLSTTKNLIKVLTTLPSLVDLRLVGTGLGDTHLPRANCLNRSTHLFPFVKYLDMSSNSFGENSSFCFLRNMTSLSFLDLSSNSLHQKGDWISDFLGDKCHLKSLNLNDNKFYGDISGAFKNLSGCWGSNLESIRLGYNEFDGHLPEELGHEMKRLTVLYVSENRLCGPIPVSLGNLRALRELGLSSNQLSGEIPISFGQLSNLESIYMDNNALEGTLSEAHFDKLTKLQDLNIGFNSRIEFKVGDDWVPPFQLHALSMQSIIFEGQFPQWIRTQKSLQELQLWNCSNIRGTLPAWLGSLKNLYHLDLSNNHIHGIIPELPSSIDWLDLSRNLINGSIPESLCRMKGLGSLDLSGNHLSGHLPDCFLGNLSSLEVAILSSNQLSGAIPNSIGGANQLQWLKLNNNSFTGQLPPSLENCTWLYVLDVGDNNLSGNLPQWIGNDFDNNLGVLRLRNNKFDGDIPSSYCQLSQLQIMDLAHNHLTGNIPRCFGNLSGMVSAVGVNVVGDFPVIGDSSVSEVMKGAMLEYTSSTSKFLVNLDLSSNRLFGEIPSELTNLIGLNGLNLSHNHLRGTIPRRIGDMKSLESFDLSSNSFSGTIPQSLSKLTSLSFLNLSNNDLSGPIPTGPQLQTFNDPSSYNGNHRLCGDPLPQKCGRIVDNGIPPRSRKYENDDRDKLLTDKIYLYGFTTSGLATGFWGYFGVLILKKSWRLALFRRMDVLIAKMLGRY